MNGMKALDQLTHDVYQVVDQSNERIDAITAHKDKGIIPTTTQSGRVKAAVLNPKEEQQSR
jgi:hypothetical protein